MVRAMLLAGILLGAALPAGAQGHLHKHRVPPAQAGAPWKELPAPPLGTGLGSSRLRIRTRSAEAQNYFSQGLNLLHCFWEFEAYRAFREAARLDPAAPMAHWGIAMALKDTDAMAQERKKALATTRSLLDGASDHEKYYLRAVARLLDEEESDEDKRNRNYQRELEALLDRYPQDQDARAFLALSTMGGYDDDGRPREGSAYSQSLLRNILASDPENAAAHHYWIHALEGSPHPEDALASADILAKLAPRSGHMVHMPGHIYYRTGDYQRAYDSFAASARVDEAYMADEHVTTAETWNYGHNLSYLIAACAESGRYREGLAWAAKLRDLPAAESYQPGSYRYAMYVGSAPARLDLRFSDWAAAAARPLEFGVPEEKISPIARAYRDGLRSYARGMAALEAGKSEEAAREALSLDALLWRLSPASAAQPEKTEHPAEDQEEEKPERVLALLGVASLDLRGNLQSVAGQNEEAVKLLKQAVRKEKEIGYGEPPVYARPALESLGYACLRAGNWDQARQAFADELIERPKNGHALFGVARALELAGKSAEAAEAYRAFRAAWSHADPELKEMRLAREWQKSHDPAPGAKPAE